MLIAAASATIAQAVPLPGHGAPIGARLGTLVRQDPHGPRGVGVRTLVLYGRELKWPIVAHFKNGKADLNGFPWDLDVKDTDRGAMADSATRSPPNEFGAMVMRAASAYKDTLAVFGESAARHAAIARLDTSAVATDADGPRAPRFYANGSCRVSMKGTGFSVWIDIVDDPPPPGPPRGSREWARSSFARLELYFRSAKDVAVVISAGGLQVTSGENARRAEHEVHIVQLAARSLVRGAELYRDDILTGAAIREIVDFEREKIPRE